MSAIIEVNNLSKSFGDFQAVDDLSFSVPKGSIYGFLGQNGAGKSTTIRMLLTLIKPDQGNITMFGYDLKKQREKILSNIGAVIERPDLYKYLTAYENVELFAKMSRTNPSKAAIMEVLDKVGLIGWENSKMGVFSQGMKQRLGIATALIHNPELIILDEPVNGLDPQGIAEMRKLILHMKNDLGKTIVVSSHLLSEMELIATDLLIIKNGRKVMEGDIKNLLNPDSAIYELITENSDTTLQILLETEWKSYFKEQIDYKLIFALPKSKVKDFNKALVANSIDVLSLRPKHSLEDFFLEKTNSIS
jgi:ABC-type multidrug transport system ATPase subunit